MGLNREAFPQGAEGVLGDLNDEPKAATTAYAESEDHVGGFLTESCKIDEGMRAEQAQLFGACTRWCGFEGANPVSGRAFAARVRETLGMTSPKAMVLSNSRKYYPGIGLITDDTEEPTP
ncbi:hypothetical protein ASE03_28745 [Kitasatospora sp. Root187]|nr:hypothetical protein ASC99_35635 [Kitasatospora sp. Root107]KRB68890.1 hypothetical protein ASE03_28745 [Kitasatospora sp. Root187]